MSMVSCWISLRRTNRLTTTCTASAPTTPSDSQATTWRRAARSAGTSAVTTWRVTSADSTAAAWVVVMAEPTSTTTRW